MHSHSQHSQPSNKNPQAGSRQASSWLAGLLLCLLLVAPAWGLPLWGVYAASYAWRTRGKARATLPWRRNLRLWGAVLLTMAGVALLQGELAALWWQLLLLASVHSLLWPPLDMRLLRSASVVAVLLLSLAMVLERQLATQWWQTQPLLASLSAYVRHGGMPAQQLSSDQAPLLRRWALPAGDVGRQWLEFEARTLSGEAGWQWSEGFRLPAEQERPISYQRRRDGDFVYQRVAFPAAGAPYITRTAYLRQPIAGERFRASVRWRSPEGIPEQAFRGVWLQEAGGDFVFSHSSAALDGEWRSTELEWQAPTSAQSPAVRIVLNNFAGFTLDIAEIRLEHWHEGQWRSLEPLAPTGLGLRLFRSDGQTQQWLQAWQQRPSEAWQQYQLAIDAQPLAGLAENTWLELHMLPENGLVFALRNLHLRPQAPTSAALSPLPRLPRQQLWFGHPNLAAHSLLSLSLVALLSTYLSLRQHKTARRWPWLLLAGLIIACSLLALALTGSRAAFGVAALALPLWLWWLTGWRWRWSYTLMLLALWLVLGTVTYQQAAFQRLALEPDINRRNIHQLAWQAFSEQPWTGIGADNFAVRWQAAFPHNSPVQHAHNFWLEFAAHYGLLGLLAALLLTAGLLGIAWHDGGWPGLALVVPLLVVNVVDYTLTHSYVFIPLALALNSLALNSLARCRSQSAEAA